MVQVICLVLNFAQEVDVLSVLRQLECVAPQAAAAHRHGHAGGTVSSVYSTTKREPRLVPQPSPLNFKVHIWPFSPLYAMQLESSFYTHTLLPQHE